jgi:hypothetical protein
MACSTNESSFIAIGNMVCVSKNSSTQMSGSCYQNKKTLLGVLILCEQL